MIDGPLRRALKALVRGLWSVELGVRRRLTPSRYRLGGACGGCARCCDRPTIRVGRVTWHLRSVRAVVVAWQRIVNGWVLVEADRKTRTLQFRCTHLDPATRRCDSYASRPFVCRDYPRALLDQPWPELFPECGFRPVVRDPAGLRAALDATDLSEEERARLARRLFLE